MTVEGESLCHKPNKNSLAPSLRMSDQPLFLKE
nr:MAG TPA: hypothetical protein [Caudoviricetes sp.]